MYPKLINPSTDYQFYFKQLNNAEVFSLQEFLKSVIKPSIMSTNKLELPDFKILEPGHHIERFFVFSSFLLVYIFL